MTADARSSTRDRLLADDRSGRFEEWRPWLLIAGFALIVLGCFATRAILESTTPQLPKLDDWSRHGNAIFPFTPLVVMFIASRDRWDPSYGTSMFPDSRPLRGGAVHATLNLLITLAASALHPRPQVLIDAFVVAVLIGLAALGGYREAFVSFRRRRRDARYAR